MGNNIFNDDFIEFLECLELYDVEYILVGGYSVIIHGYSRTTGDMDLYLRPTITNYQRLKKAFLMFRMSMFDMTERNFLDTENFDVFEFGRPPVSIDIMTKMKGVSFAEVYGNRLRYSVNDNLKINVIHLSQLIKAKKSAGRLKDLNDIEHLKGFN